ncbi:MAG: tRNA (adenosine(37)-N6)-threonylcarbamoyltransferase complex ATPase subunit type 1 TsaE [Thermodesulfovibrio sp.]|nr:tRNA (adenosine(37)-N6)-threonylcarbamoyltransferase complex ATPase subunit type 1 TsaE [Thermodesulfovibrio sp.]
MRFRSSSAEGTEQIGQRIGRCLNPGDIVCLYGDLGTGKTTLVRGIASTFGIPGRDITSASFTVIAEYPVDPFFYHIDLYRIRNRDDLDSTGIWDLIGGASVSVIEWAENLGELSGQRQGIISIWLSDCGEGVREITMEGIHADTWNNL